jgi:hypothetical protein
MMIYHSDLPVNHIYDRNEGVGRSSKNQPDVTAKGRDGSVYVFEVKARLENWQADMDFAQKLRDAIKESGVSQYQLAKASEVPQGAISVFLNGGDLRLSTFNRLAYYMGLELRQNQAKAPKKIKPKATGRKPKK